MTVLESVWWYSSILKYGVGTTRAPKALAKLPQSLIAFAQGGRYATLINRQLHGGSLTWWLVLWASLLFCADFLYDSSCQMSNWRGSDDAEENAEGQNGQAKKTVGGLTEKRMFLCTKKHFSRRFKECLLLVRKKPFHVKSQEISYKQLWVNSGLTGHFRDASNPGGGATGEENGSVHGNLGTLQVCTIVYM